MRTYHAYMTILPFSIYFLFLLHLSIIIKFNKEFPLDFLNKINDLLQKYKFLWIHLINHKFFLNKSLNKKSILSFIYSPMQKFCLSLIITSPQCYSYLFHQKLYKFSLMKSIHNIKLHHYNQLSNYQ